jgi:hypothetical protein
MIKYSIKINQMLENIMKLLDPNGICPIPTVKIVQRTRERWLGLCDTSFSDIDENGMIHGLNSEILIQKYVFKDNNLLMQVMAHECCHHVDSFQAALIESYPLVLDKLNNLEHGESFLKLCDIFNKHYEYRFDINGDTDAFIDGPSILVLLHKDENNKIQYCYTKKPTSKQILQIACCFAKSETDFKLIRSNKIMFHAPYGQFGVVWLHPEEQKQIEYLEYVWDMEPNIMIPFLENNVKSGFFEYVELLRSGTLPVE